MQCADYSTELTEDLLQCTICFEGFKDPKVLRCQHTFCRSCLENYWPYHRLSQGQQSQMLPCPTCRHMTTLPRTGMVGLPSDFKVSKIEDLVSRLATEENRNKSSGMKCNICMSIHRASVADFYCADCEKHLCEVCATRHSEVLLFKQHKVSYISKHESSQINRDEVCAHHLSEKIKYLCTHCMVAACTVCVMEAHGDHDIMDINKGIQYLRQKLHDITEKINLNMTKVKDTVTSLRAGVDAQKEYFNMATTVIKTRTNEIVKQAKQCEKELLQVIQENHIKSLQDSEQQLCDVLSKSDRYNNSFKSIQTAMSEPSVTMFLKDFQTIESNALSLLTETSTQQHNHNQTVLVKFLPSTDPIKHGTLQYTNLSIIKEISNTEQNTSENITVNEQSLDNAYRMTHSSHTDLPEKDVNRGKHVNHASSDLKKSPNTYNSKHLQQSLKKTDSGHQMQEDKFGPEKQPVNMVNEPSSYQPVKVVRSVMGLNRNTPFRSSYRVDSSQSSSKSLHQITTNRPATQPEHDLDKITQKPSFSRQGVNNTSCYTDKGIRFSDKKRTTQSNELQHSTDEGYDTAQHKNELTSNTSHLLGAENIEITATFPTYKQMCYSNENLDSNMHMTQDAKPPLSKSLATKEKLHSKPTASFQREVRVTTNRPMFIKERKPGENVGLNLSAGPPPYSKHNPHKTVQTVKAPPIPNKPPRTFQTIHNVNQKNSSQNVTPKQSRYHSYKHEEPGTSASVHESSRCSTVQADKLHNVVHISEDSISSTLSSESTEASYQPNLSITMQTSQATNRMMLVQKPEIVARLNKSELPVNFPPAIAFLPNGQIVLAEMMTCRIGLYDKKLKFVHLISHGKFQPTYITVLKGNNLAIIDAGEVGYCVKILNLKGECIAEWGHGMFRYPSSIVCNGDNNFVIADSEERTICIRKPDSRLLSQFRVTNDSSAKMIPTSANNSISIALDNYDNIVVSDNKNSCIRVFDLQGNLLKRFGCQGKSEGEFTGSIDAAVDMNNNFIIADMGSKRISMFNHSGKFVKHLVEDTGHTETRCVPESLWIDHDGTLVVIHSPAQWQYQVLVYQLYE